MLTAPVSNASQGTQGALASSARALVVGLGWAAIMLFVLGSWMRSKYGDAGRPATYVLLIAAAGAAGLAIWQAFTLWFKQETPEAKAVTLSQQRRLFSLIFLAAGIGFIGLAFYLGIGKKATGNYGFLLENIGESIGILFFGLISLGAGFQLSQSTSDETASPVQFLSQKAPLLKFIMLLFGIASFVGFGYIAYTNRAEQKYMDWLPELFALVAASVLFITCFLWLNTGALDEFGIRLFVLVFGGAFGLILFCYSLGRIVYWRQDILLGGLDAWQGANAWRFWTCFYLQFAALVLMFGSFNLARADIRTNVHLRRVMYGYDTIVQSLLLLEILVVLNIVLYAMFPYTFDWTKSRGAYALSDSTKNLISNLKKETHAVVLMSQNDPVYRDLRNLLDNCQALSTKFKVEYLSPDVSPEEYRLLATRFPKLTPESPMAPARGVLLVNGPMPDKIEHDVPYAFVSEQKLVKEDFGEMRGATPPKRKRVFKGEEEIIKEFKFLVQGKKRKVYFLQGNEEADINVDEHFIRQLYKDGLLRQGLAAFAERLTRDNYQVFGLNFNKEIPEAKPPENKIIYAKEGPDKKKDVPSDCDTLIVTATPKPLPQEVVDAIERYMDRDGKLMVFLDVITDAEGAKLQNSGLESLLKRHAVEVQDGFGLAVRFNVRPDPTKLTAIGAKSEHVLARQFAGRSIDFPDSARILKASEGQPGRFRAEPVLQHEVRRNDRAVMTETDATLLQKDVNLHLVQLRNTNQLMPRLVFDPITLGVAVSETEGGKPRMVVIGDTDFITNYQVTPSPRSPTAMNNYSFAVSALEWMAERESIGAQPKVTNTFSIDPSVDTTRMVLLPGWLMFLALTGLGIGIWLVRRR